MTYSRKAILFMLFDVASIFNVTMFLIYLQLFDITILDMIQILFMELINIAEIK